MTSSSHSSLRASRAQAMVEFALTFPVIVMLLAMLFEFGRYVIIKQTAVNLTRETGMLAVRRLDSPAATNFPNVMAAAASIAQPVNLTNDGRIYVAQVMRRASDNQPAIVQYGAFGNLSANAKVLGAGLGGVATLPSTVNLQSNQILYVVETYLRFVPVMRFGFGNLNSTVGETNRVYDTAYF
ncbi:MAG TPA: pilus assembly protein [Verrucomicrobiae bacterium]|nr:pilus assembly protein [Verrucomicrobiae bacterium]